MILVRAEIARTSNGSQHALAVRPIREFAEDRRRPVGTHGLRRPPTLLHDDRHRARGRSRGAFVFVTLFLQSALHFPGIGKKGQMPALHDLAFRKRRDLPVTGPLQGLRMQRKPLPIKGAPRVNPPNFLLQRCRQTSPRGSAQGRGVVGESRGSHRVSRDAKVGGELPLSIFALAREPMKIARRSPPCRGANGGPAQAGG